MEFKVIFVPQEWTLFKPLEGFKLVNAARVACACMLPLERISSEGVSTHNSTLTIPEGIAHVSKAFEESNTRSIKITTRGNIIDAYEENGCVARYPVIIRDDKTAEVLSVIFRTKLNALYLFQIWKQQGYKDEIILTTQDFYKEGERIAQQNKDIYSE